MIVHPKKGTNGLSAHYPTFSCHIVMECVVIIAGQIDVPITHVSLLRLQIVALRFLDTNEMCSCELASVKRI